MAQLPRASEVPQSPTMGVTPGKELAPFVPAPALGDGAAVGRRALKVFSPKHLQPFHLAQTLFLAVFMPVSLPSGSSGLCCWGLKCSPGPPAACRSSVCLHYLSLSGLPCGDRAAAVLGNLERKPALLASASGRLNEEDLGSGTGHAPLMKVATKTALSPLARSLGNLFPGPSRLSKPRPAQPQRCWLRFPRFLVFSSPLPQALPAFWPSPHPSGTESHRGGVGKGAREGAHGGARPYQEGAGREESPTARVQDGVQLNLPLPSLPQELALSPSKAGMTRLPGCSPKLPLGLFCCCPLYRECSSRLQCQCKPCVSSSPEPSATSSNPKHCPFLHKGPVSLLEAASSSLSTPEPCRHPKPL